MAYVDKNNFRYNLYLGRWCIKWMKGMWFLLVIKAMNVKLSILAPGDISATSTDAINGSQLYSAMANRLKKFATSL